MAETKRLKNDIGFSLSFNYPCYLCFHYYGSLNVTVTAAQLITAACNHDVCNHIPVCHLSGTIRTQNAGQ